MAQMKPQCVKGFHLNMVTGKQRGLAALVGFTREDVRRLYGLVGFMEGNVLYIILSGWLYRLEKFSTWTDFNNRDLAADWSFLFPVFMKFTLDYLLTNTMIYWTTGSIVSAMRIYKENLKTNIENRLDNECLCCNTYVPTGLATFLNEIMHVPQPWARFRNIYSYFPRGSHFAAIEEARLLADDLLQFVRKVEKL
uniref:Epoxide hydrolase 1 n=1 Tax=Salmo trutta TaxID=8032 RepID=A0A674BD74_SALTR